MFNVHDQFNDNKFGEVLFIMCVPSTPLEKLAVVSFFRHNRVAPTFGGHARLNLL